MRAASAPTGGNVAPAAVYSSRRLRPTGRARQVRPSSSAALSAARHQARSTSFAWGSAWTLEPLKARFDQGPVDRKKKAAQAARK